MPFTPLHFGPHACVGLPLGRRIDLPVFLLANVAVDIEPLLVLTYGLDYPVHGYCHTLLFGAGVGLILACVAWPLRGLIKAVMDVFRLPYAGTFKAMAFSAIAGVWLHVCFDSVIYTDIRPLWPSDSNPLLGLVTSAQLETICRASMVAAAALYVVLTCIRVKRRT